MTVVKLYKWLGWEMLIKKVYKKIKLMLK